MTGMGVLLRMLSGNEDSVNAFTRCLGKPFSRIKLSDNQLKLWFADGVLSFSDEGQSCCESRYMECSDNLAEFADAVLIGATLKDAPSVPTEYGDHEVQFLQLETSKGPITVSNHNEHNGYYGGFCVRCSWSSYD